ncbi:hypothetical protein [Spiroplasma alleghenense]|uniref:Uncharacterized protein n=1 Tax=Spiroplasma alleghenense TaxID=216931 RepID=A0A345Z3S3_9MOLU|nr:hypothetical protein [Spiroplasma alleghenense]AXK51252.1 hypothetical protein SALLE_v1c05800 [Spiroplasma alleghenense]
MATKTTNKSKGSKPQHLETRKKASDPKPKKIVVEGIKLTEVQEKFIWEKAEPVSGHNQSIYRRDVCGAIIKVQEKNLESEFGWVLTLADPNGDSDEVNNIIAMHWMNAKVKRKPDEMWIAPVTGSWDTKDTYNELRDVKIPAEVIQKVRKTTLFQDTKVEPKRINLQIRKSNKK